MSTWMRGLALRAAVLCALLVSLLASHAHGIKPTWPFGWLDSLDQAFSLVYDRAEKQVAALEAQAPQAPRCDVSGLLAQLDDHITAEDRAATVRLDVELALVDSLSPGHRAVVRGCIERHLQAARDGLRRAIDPAVRAEYAATCERLRTVRKLLA